jgi:hypothetical protein
MDMAPRLVRLATLLLFLTCSESRLANCQTAVSSQGSSGEKATVIVAVDLRELTSVRDAPHVGDVFFRRVDDKYQARANGPYDFGVQGSVAADWSATFGGRDENRAPHLFEIEPGTYVIERIKIGSGATTIGRGYDLTSHRQRFGIFVVRPGEIVNLGRLTVHMHWHQGFFDAQIKDNSDEVRRFLAESHPKLASKVQAKLLTVIPKFPFQAGGGLL